MIEKKETFEKMTAIKIQTNTAENNFKSKLNCTGSPFIKE